MANKTFLVLGGGVSGLAAAWNLARKGDGARVVLLEANQRVGGWVRSVKTRQGGIFELGPRSMRTAGRQGKTALAMLSDLHLDPFLVPITPRNKAASRRLIFTDHHGLVDVPAKFSDLLRATPPFSTGLLTTILKEPFVGRNLGNEDESVHDFMSRRFSREVADWLVDPLCRGVFAGSSRELSVRSAFPLLHKCEDQFGSVILGMLRYREMSEAANNPLVQQARREKWSLYSLEGGLERITESLQVALLEEGGEIHMSSPATQLQFTSNRAKVSTEQGEYEVDHLISTIPANALARLLTSDHPSLANLHSGIKSVSVGMVNLEYAGHVIPKHLRQSFGYLVPSHQQSKILGTVFDSSTFPELDAPSEMSTRLTVMMGGRWFEELFGSPDAADREALRETALEELEDHLGISVEPVECLTSIHKEAIPHYRIGHAQRLGQIHSYLSEHHLPVTLLGSSYAGVSVNDCITNALDQTSLLLLSY